MEKNLIYGVYPVHESLAVGHASKLRALASDLDALARCNTYGDVKSAEFSDHGPWAGPDLTEELAEHDDNEPYDWQEDTPGMVDGDWPPMPTALIFDVFPEGDSRWEEIRSRLNAKIVSTVFNGEYAEIPPDKDRELAAFLTDQGFMAIRDEALISKVGRWE